MDALRLKARCQIGKSPTIQPVLIEGAGRRRRVGRAVISSRFTLQLEFSQNTLILTEENDGHIFLSCCPSPKRNASSCQFCALSKDSIFHRSSFLWFSLGPLKAIYLPLSSRRLLAQSSPPLQQVSISRGSCRPILPRHLPEWPSAL